MSIAIHIDHFWRGVLAGSFGCALGRAAIDVGTARKRRAALRAAASATRKEGT